MRVHCATGLFALAATLLLAGAVHADTFGSGENQFEIPFVTIGSPGNAADTTGAPNPAGAVGYTYRIGKYEVPEEAIRKANELSALSGDPLGITLDDRGLNKPATSVSWFEAARFVNWLNEEKGFSPAYKFDASGEFQLWEPTDDGYNPNNLFRNSDARYVLPSVDEWYKAAFFDPQLDDYWDFPTGSNAPPTPVESGTAPGTAVWNQTTGPADVMLAGGESPFETVGQGGNVIEWLEGVNEVPSAVGDTPRIVRGGDSFQASSALAISSEFQTVSLPFREPFNGGIRIGKLPEPSALSVLVFPSLLLVGRLRSR